MTEEQIALARRAVACKGWRWMAGMSRLRDCPPNMVDFLKKDGRVPESGDDWPYEEWKVLPDLSDPATLGCLLALVREAWGDHATSFANGYEEPQDVWVVHNGRFSSDDYGHEIAKGSTEVEALVVALEAAQ